MSVNMYINIYVYTYINVYYLKEAEKGLVELVLLCGRKQSKNPTVRGTLNAQRAIVTQLVLCVSFAQPPTLSAAHSHTHTHRVRRQLLPPTWQSCKPNASAAAALCWLIIV